MSCISSNFSSFFLNTLNDPSEFSKYLSNGELKCTNFEEFQVFATQQSTQQQQQQQQQQSQYSHSNGVGVGSAASDFAYDAAAAETPAMTASTTTAATPPASSAAAQQSTLPLSNRWPTAVATPNGHAPAAAAVAAAAAAAQHFDGSFEFIKYLRHSTDFTPTGGSGSNGGGGGGGGSSSSAGSVGDAADCAATADKGSKLGAGAAAGRGLTASPPLPLPASPVGASGGGGGVGGIGLLDLDSTSIAQKSRSASRKVAALLSSVSRSSNSLDANSSTLDAVFDHDSKQTMFELQHLTSTSNGSNGSNSNESSLELLAFPNSHLNASNSNTSSEEHCGEFGMGLLSGASCSSASAGAGGAPKLLGSFVIKENFDVHPSHKVEEGIFQHMNKLPSKKKDTLKQLGVRFTGQMTFTDKSIVVENFIKFCEEYDIKDHRPWLSLNQCGLNKPEQIKFARYLGQGLPTFTLFCIYSNFKNLFCTKRTEIYTKDGYNLPYILDKTKRFLANTTADLKNMAAANDGSLEFASSSSSSGSNSNNNNNNNSNSNVNSNSSSSVNSNSNSSVNSLNSNSLSSNTVNSYVTAAVQQQQQQAYAGTSAGTALPLLPPPPLPHTAHPLGPPPRSLEQLIIYENYPVHEQHRIEDGVCTHISRLPPKKQELLKQFGIQSSSQQCLSNYEKCILIENFIKFCNEYQISDHRPFLDFHESALSKCEQLKFVRYLGQGLSNLTLNKIYVAFKDLLGNGRSEKAGVDNYNLDAILKKKRKNLYNRLHSAANSVDLTSYDAAAQQAQQPPTQSQQHTLITAAAPRPHHAFAALTAATQHSGSSSSEVCNDLTLPPQYSYSAPR